MPKSKRKGGEIMKTMIYLDQQVHTRLKYLALDKRVSMAELIRRAVDGYLKKYPKKGGRKQ